jgi:CHAD domain-containing protein
MRGKASTAIAAKSKDPNCLCGDSLGRLLLALRKQWKRYRKELKRAQKKVSEKAIHDSRVGTRRLLAILDLLAGFLPHRKVKKISDALKQHLDSFDDLRDSHVQLRLVGKMKRKFTAARDFEDYLSAREKRFARRTSKQLHKIKTGRLGKLVGECLNEVEQKWRNCKQQNANDRLFRALHGAFQRTSRLRDQIDARDTKTIHCTRVAFKRFRYMVEALADNLRFADERRLEAMHDYQGRMGDIQDVQVLLAAVDKYLCKHETDPRAASRFRKELLRQREELVKRYLAQAAALSQFWQ